MVDGHDKEMLAIGVPRQTRRGVSMYIKIKKPDNAKYH